MTTRIVCISDTHAMHNRMPQELPRGDALIHGGDFSSTGVYEDIQRFRQFMDQQQHAQKIVIAGNHDTSMDTPYYVQTGAEMFHERSFARSSDEEKEAYSRKCRETICGGDFTYLEDSACTLQGTNQKVWGSPWQPRFCDWAFNVQRGEEIRTKWDLIPDDTDILITHGPPHGILDMNDEGQPCGCEELLRAVQERVKPRLHIFGHIHEGYGTYSDGTTLFVNASTCTVEYQATNPPIVIDYPHDPSIPPSVAESGK
eukprot:gb/GECG01015688.1/.p1 GENE.gb/GECG01015688.1/~~gb/GECG01015688.1/.p1  ORF type:complete len:257 (+),score=31.28 gb/GECG01015688.1/:1-771(+)